MSFNDQSPDVGTMLDPPSQASGRSESEDGGMGENHSDWPLPPTEEPIQLKEALDEAWRLSIADPPLPSMASTVQPSEQSSSVEGSIYNSTEGPPKYIEHWGISSVNTGDSGCLETSFDSEPTMDSEIIPNDSQEPCERAKVFETQQEARDTTSVSFEEIFEDKLDLTSLASSMSFTNESCFGSIQAAIQEIQKEASRMDTIMALDQLKTAQLELSIAKKNLEERSGEVEDLKEKLQGQEEQLSFVELERDLYQADTKKLKEDLRTCVDRMFDISEVAGASSLLTTESRDPRNESGKSLQEARATRGRQSATRETEGIGAGRVCGVDIFTPMAQTVGSILGSEEAKAVLAEVAKLSSSTKSTFSNEPGPVFRSFATSQQTRRPESSLKIVDVEQESRSRSHIEYAPNNCDRYASQSISMRNASKRVTRKSPNRRRGPSQKSGSLQSCCSTAALSEISGSISSAGGRPSSKWIEDDEGEEAQESRRCGLFFRRPRKTDPTILEMKREMKRLQKAMWKPVKASTMLRKEMSAMTLHYEAKIREIHDTHMKAQLERSEWQARKQKITEEQRLAIDRLENEIRQRNQQIHELQERLEAAGGDRNEPKYEI